MPRPPSHLLDVLWRPSGVVATVLAAQALAVLMTLAPGKVDSRWVLFGLWSLLMQWIALGTLGVLYALRGALVRLPLPLLPACVMAVLLGVTLLVVAASDWLFVPILGESVQGPLNWRVGGIVASMGVFGMLALHSAWRAHQYDLQAKQAELEALRARVQPHFLFNTLNSAISLARHDPPRTEAVLMDLADLFRAALGSKRSIPLADELALGRRYLDIERVRFGPRLELRWNVPTNLPEIEVPVLCVQPLLENAVHHGIEPRSEGGWVGMDVVAGDRQVVVEVTNPVAPAGTQARHGIGLAAVQARMAGRGGLATTVRDGVHVATLTFTRAPAGSSAGQPTTR